MQPRLKAGWRSSRASVIAVTCAHFLFTILSSSQPFMNWYSALNTQPFRNNLIWQALVNMEFCIRKGVQWKIFANQTCRSSRMRFPWWTTFGAVGQQDLVITVLLLVEEKGKKENVFGGSEAFLIFDHKVLILSQQHPAHQSLVLVVHPVKKTRQTGWNRIVQ